MEEEKNKNKKIEPQNNSSELESIRTYEKDMARALRKKDSSLNTVFMAEEKKRQEEEVKKPKKVEKEDDSPSVAVFKNQIFFTFGIILLLLAVISVSLSWLFVFRENNKETPIVDNKAFILSDKVREVSLFLSLQNIEQILKESREETQLEANAVLSIEFIKENPEGGKNKAKLSEVITALGWKMPGELERALTPSYAFGVHSFGGNEPFVVFGVESYEQAFAGMLEWEKTLMSDLSPFFKEPQKNVTFIPVNNATSTATSTASTTPEFQESYVSTSLSFKDAVIRNKDARILEKDGQIYAIYSFIDRQTLVITTNPDTLYEAATRIPKDF